MANRVDVLREIAPHIGEHTTRRVPILDENDDPLPLAGIDLYWFLAKQAGAPPLLQKESGAGITVEDTSYAAIEFESDDFSGAGITAGVWYHELWDMSDQLLLAYGDFWVLPGSPQEA